MIFRWSWISSASVEVSAQVMADLTLIDFILLMFKQKPAAGLELYNTTEMVQIV